MDRVRTHLRQFAADERGATAIEYCMIASLMSIAIVGGATTIGQRVLAMFQSILAGL